MRTVLERYEIGVLTYLDRALAGAYRDKAEAYRLGLAALDLAARRRSGMPFADCSAEKQDALLAELEQGVLPDFQDPPAARLLRDAASPPAGGALRRPCARRQPRQAGLEAPGPSGDLARKLRRGEPLRGTRDQGRQDPVARRRGLLPRRRPERTRRYPRLRSPERCRAPEWTGGRRSGGDGGYGQRGGPRPGSRGLARGGLGSRAVAHQARLLAGRAGVRLLLQGRDGAQVPERDAPLATQRGRTDPGGHLLVGAHDERRGRLGHPLGRRAQALPSPPLSLPHPRARELRRGRVAGRAHFDRLARILRRAGALLHDDRVPDRGRGQRGQPVRPAQQTLPPAATETLPHERDLLQGHEGDGFTPLPDAGRREQRAIQRVPGDHLLRLERRFWSFQRRAVAPRPDLGPRGACDRQPRTANPLQGRPRPHRLGRARQRRRVRGRQRDAVECRRRVR